MRKEESTLTINEHGDKVWRNKEGNWHRIGGPAIEYSNGTKYWFDNGKQHRIDGPAVEWSSGRKEWRKNGKLHRIDGPAIDYGDGRTLWYIRGVHFKRKEAFFEALTDEEKEIALSSEVFLNA